MDRKPAPQHNTEKCFPTLRSATLITLGIGLAFAMTATFLFVSNFRINQRISALENLMAGLRREHSLTESANTSHAPATGLGVREKRSVSQNASPDTLELEKRLLALEKRYEEVLTSSIAFKSPLTLKFRR